MRCRPCERRDPYAAASPWGTWLDGLGYYNVLWLWVPAFAGTTGVEGPSRNDGGRRDVKVCTACAGGPAGDRRGRDRAGRRRAKGQDRRAPAVVVGAGVHRAGQGLFPRGRSRHRTEVLRRGAADRGGDHLGRCRFRHHGVHRWALQSRRQGHAEGDRRHEPREGGLSADRLFRQQQRLCGGAQDAEGPCGQAHRGHASRLQLSLFARPARRQIRLQARGRKGAAAAVAVECRGGVEGRNRRRRAAADLDGAGAGRFRRREIPRLGRRRDAVAARRGVRFAEDADQQAAGDEAAGRAGARRPRISRRDPGFGEGRQGRRSTTRQNRCSRSSQNTPICRWSRWSAIAPISIPTASST